MGGEIGRMTTNNYFSMQVLNLDQLFGLQLYMWKFSAICRQV